MHATLQLFSMLVVHLLWEKSILALLIWCINCWLVHKIVVFSFLTVFRIKEPNFYQYPIISKRCTNFGKLNFQQAWNNFDNFWQTASAHFPCRCVHCCLVYLFIWFLSLISMPVHAECDTVLLILAVFSLFPISL